MWPDPHSVVCSGALGRSCPRLSWCPAGPQEHLPPLVQPLPGRLRAAPHLWTPVGPRCLPGCLHLPACPGCLPVAPPGSRQGPHGILASTLGLSCCVGLRPLLSASLPKSPVAGQAALECDAPLSRWPSSCPCLLLQEDYLVGGGQSHAIPRATSSTGLSSSGIRDTRLGGMGSSPGVGALSDLSEMPCCPGSPGTQMAVVAPLLLHGPHTSRSLLVPDF